MLRQGEVAEAVKTLERAVELTPEDASVNGHLGDAYWAAGRKLEATYQWRRALTFNPEPDDVAKLEAKLQSGGRQSAVISGQ
jgi:Flp pilus assembly protein TadD